MIEDELRKLAKLAKDFLIMGAQMPPGPFIYVFFINIWGLIHPEKVEPPCSSSFLLHDPLLEKGENSISGRPKDRFFRLIYCSQYI